MTLSLHSNYFVERPVLSVSTTIPIMQAEVLSSGEVYSESNTKALTSILSR